MSKKKVLILSASPRKDGNSELLCKEFEKGAIEAGHHVELISTRNKKINYCLGCGVCNSKHKCVQKDDMNEILDKMVEADVIVMATPVYFYSMNAQMKTLIDRTVPRYTEMANKELYYILAAADADKKMLHRTIEGFRGFAEDCLEGSIEKGIIYGINAWQIGEIVDTPAMKNAYVAGKNL